MIVTRYPYVEEEESQAWCDELILTLLKDLPFELQTNALIVTISDSIKMESSDFFALYSHTVAKIYDRFEEIG